MPIKESSDELTINTPAPVVKPVEERTLKDYFALIIASCGVGYLPLAPGTWGSLVGVALYFFLFVFSHHVLFARVEHNQFNQQLVWTLELTSVLVVIFVVTMIGIWAASRAEKLLRKKDPSIVVIDEVAGQMIALIAVPLHWHYLLASFILFRGFDIVKPFPLRRLEKLPGGTGIMLDDVGAGLYALVLLQLWLHFFMAR